MIKAKPKECSFCGELKVLWKSTPKACKECWGKNSERKPINKKSEAQKARDKSYSVIAKLYKSANPECKAKLDGCTHNTTEIHHKRGKISDLLCDIRYFLPTCRSCHHWIERHPEESKKLGFSLDRLSID